MYRWGRETKKLVCMALRSGSIPTNNPWSHFPSLPSLHVYSLAVMVLLLQVYIKVYVCVCMHDRVSQVIYQGVCVCVCVCVFICVWVCACTMELDKTFCDYMYNPFISMWSYKIILTKYFLRGINTDVFHEWKNLTDKWFPYNIGYHSQQLLRVNEHF